MLNYKEINSINRFIIIKEFKKVIKSFLIKECFSLLVLWVVVIVWFMIMSFVMIFKLFGINLFRLGGLLIKTNYDWKILGSCCIFDS